jgi:hypothetical protein
MRPYHRLFSLTLLCWLPGCFEPAADLFDSATGEPEPPAGPAPDQDGYRCTSASGSACPAPRRRIWMPGWIVIQMAARGNKAAFVAYPALPGGGADLGASGHGALLLGEGIGWQDGFLASFDRYGKKRFARRLEIFDEPPPPDERPTLIGMKIVAGDAIRVQTAFHLTKKDQPTIAPIHLFAFTMEGSQVSREEVPIVPGSYNGWTWPAADGTLWIKTYPGPFRRYSEEGAVLAMLDLPEGADMRGFAPTGPHSGLINLTTKGYTNELHRFDLGAPLTLLFEEETFPQFHASALVHTLGFAGMYFVEMSYDGLSHRFARIDPEGNRGPVTTVGNVNHRFTVLDGGDGVFYRFLPSGTEWIVQPLSASGGS